MPGRRAFRQGYWKEDGRDTEGTAWSNIEHSGGKSEVFVQCFSNLFSIWPHRPIQSAGDERRARTCALAQNPRQHAETAGVVPRGCHRVQFPSFLLKGSTLANVLIVFVSVW